MQLKKEIVSIAEFVRILGYCACNLRPKSFNPAKRLKKEVNKFIFLQTSNNYTSINLKYSINITYSYLYAKNINFMLIA
jgi:hypothetical protein